MQIRPTGEQKYAIEMVHKYNRVKGFALAGTGKTTLLQMIAKSLPNKKILYLAFNRSMAQEAKQKMPSNTEVRTVHSLAYKYIVKQGGYKIAKDRLDFFNIAKTLDIEPNEVFKYFKYFTKFTQSDVHLNDLEGIHGLLRGSFLTPTERRSCVVFIRRLFAAMTNHEFPVTHDFYLKLFEHEIHHFKSFDFKFDFDLVLLDEAQDSNEVTRSVFDGLSGKKVMVGDTFQKIYGFRGAVDIMEDWEEEATFSLTESFRFLAGSKASPPFQVNQANIVLKYFLNSSLSLKVADFDHSELMQKQQTYCLLCRTNTSVIEIIDEEDRIKTTRHPEVFFKIFFDIFNKKINLGCNTENMVDYVKKLEELSEQTGELDMAAACKLVRKYKYSQEKFTKLYKKAAGLYCDITLSNFVGTAHSCKGLEFDFVKLCDDFAKPEDLLMRIIDKKKLKLSKKYLSINDVQNIFKEHLDIAQKEELNLLYMSQTRARIKLETSWPLSESSRYIISR